MIFRRKKNDNDGQPDLEALDKAFERFKQTHDLHGSAEAFSIDPRLLEARIRPFKKARQSSMADKLVSQSVSDTFSKSKD